MAFLDRASAPAHLYVTVPASEANSTDFVLSGFDIAISESRMNHPQDDPLLKCLSDVDFLINKLNAETVEHVEELKSNMVTVKDDVVINGTVTVTEINSTETPITYGKIQVNIEKFFFFSAFIKKMSDGTGALQLYGRF